MARASLMYSESKTSSMAERTRRILAATKNQPNVTAGRKTLFQSCFPDGGTQSSRTAKKKMSIMPNQKVGADCPTKATRLPI